MKLVCNRSFILTTDIGKQTSYDALRMASHKNQSRLPSCLILIYIYDLPVKVGREFAYADDLAILHYASDCQAIERTFTQDMATLSSYLYK